MRVKVRKFDLKLPKSEGRSVGLHVSEIIRDLALIRGILDSKYDSKELDSDNDTTMMQIGLGWEDYLAKYQHPEIDFHPGELELDGIYMSPDGISMVDGNPEYCCVGVERKTWKLHEFKFTRKSCREFEAKLKLGAKHFKMWMWQVKAYRLALNRVLAMELMPPCYDAALHVMFSNGNYSWDDRDPDSKPNYQIAEFTFKQEELDENWEMLLEHSKSMRERLTK